MTLTALDCIEYLNTKLENKEVDFKNGYKEAIRDIELLVIEQKTIEEEKLKEIEDKHCI